MLNVDQFWSKLSIWIVIIFGMSLRFLPAIQVSFPLNDGGMFFVMIRDLQANGLIIPSFTSYNLSDIPFAYPPLGMYLGAFFSSILKISVSNLLIWLPSILSALIVPVFYLLALRIFRDKTKSLVATILVAFLPSSFDWLIMGGGLTRSLGVFFFVIAIYYVLGLFRDENAKSISPSVVFCSLAVLSHPEVGLQTAGICFLIWLIYGRNFIGGKHALAVIVGTGLFTSVWWGTVLFYHGVEPFLSAIQTGIREKLFASWFYSFFSVQGGLPLLPVLTLLGLFVAVKNKELFLVGWAFLPFLLDPRNAPAIAMYAFILLSTDGLYFILNKIHSLIMIDRKDRFKKIYIQYVNLSLLLLLLLVVFLSWSSIQSLMRFSLVSLKESDRMTMEWIKNSTPENSNFLLLTNDGGISPMVDAYQEWFPALTERHSENTLQGLEWTLGNDFYKYSQRLIKLQSCEKISCIQNWISEENAQVDYLLVRPGRISHNLLNSLQLGDLHQAVYQTEEVIIYEYK